MHRLDGRRALVCGSTRGIGRATAEAFAAAGAEVILVARDPARLSAAVAALSGAGHASLVADFADPEHAAETVRAHVEATGPVHILVNNTGGPAGGPVVDATPAQFTGAFAAHLLCNHLLSQALIPGMRDAAYGRIINIISTSVKQPIRGLGVSNTIRGAVASWAKTLAGEVGRYGITVNNVLPGSTITGRHHALIQARSEKTGIAVAEIEEAMLAEIPLGRFAEPSEIAAAALFLASPAGGYITGINLPVDGGRLGTL
jgi:3-oxoacyl-[acyl-carrier protein] reductase